MSTELRFPSGITVTQAKKDAKKLARAESIKLHEAQNRIAKSNGMNLPWDKAIASLSAGKSKGVVEGIFSCDSITLMTIQKEAVANRKQTGIPYSDALLEACELYGFEDPDLAAKALFVKVPSMEFHRILAGPVLLALYVSGKDLFISGGFALDKPSHGFFWRGSVVYGDVTELCKAESGDTNINRKSLNPGWWICKYSIREPRIDLSGLTSAQVESVANLLGYEIYNEEENWLRFSIGPKLFYRTPVFESVKKWAKAHPRLAAQGRSEYSGLWGPVALGKIPLSDM